MSTRIDHVLAQWYPRRDQYEWVLATIVNTERSVYRKAGAIMLINELGETLGLLSGGCLEGDLKRLAKKVITQETPVTVHYDFDPESDVPWQKGLGCGGAVEIQLHSIHQENNYYGFADIHACLSEGEALEYHRLIDIAEADKMQWKIKTEPTQGQVFKRYSGEHEKEWCSILFLPRPHILIIGGGIDAEPLAEIANSIGWRVSVVEGRVGYAAPEKFPNARCYHHDVRALNPNIFTQKVDAVVVMQHNVNLDAAALQFCASIQPRYVGLLGPSHRRNRVMAAADISEKDFVGLLKGPTGFDIGASLPETIALSICAEIHQVIEGNGQAELLHPVSNANTIYSTSI